MKQYNKEETLAAAALQLPKTKYENIKRRAHQALSNPAHSSLLGIYYNVWKLTRICGIPATVTINKYKLRETEGWTAKQEKFLIFNINQGYMQSMLTRFYEQTNKEKAGTSTKDLGQACSHSR